MGIDAFLVASSLSGVVAQRLLRVVCKYCAEEVVPTISQQELFKRNNIEIKTMKKAVGCEHCNNTGYKGRVAIFEIVDINENIVRMVSNEAKEYEILEQVRKDGTKLLIEAGLEKVRLAQTTLDEVMRISLD